MARTTIGTTTTSKTRTILTNCIKRPNDGSFAKPKRVGRGANNKPTAGRGRKGWKVCHNVIETPYCMRVRLLLISYYYPCITTLTNN